MRQYYFLFLLFISIHSNAQQCGWGSYRAFVLDIRDENSNKPVNGLKVTLVDENGVPYERYHYKTDRNDNITERWYEPLTFWENGKKKIIADQCTPPTFVHVPFKDDYYVVLIKINNSNSKASGRYWVKVEDVDGNRNQGIFPESYYHLNFQQSMELCKSGFMSSEQKDSVFIHGRDTLRPVSIKLKKSPDPLAPIPKKINGDVFTTEEYQIIHTLYARDEEMFRESLIKDIWIIRDINTLKTIQVISMNRDGNIPPKMNAELFKSGDFRYNGAVGMAFLRDVKPVSGGLDQSRYDFYLYDSIQEKFIEDPVLSAEYGLIFNPQKKETTRTVTVLREGYTSVDTYVLVGYNQWILRKSEKKYPPVINKPNPYPKYQKTTGCLVWIEGTSDDVPVIDFRSDLQYSKVISDTFVFINTCTESITITTSHNSGFTVPSNVRAQDTGYAIFRETVRNPISSAQLDEKYVILRVNDAENTSVVKRYALAGSAGTKSVGINGELKQADYPSSYSGFVKRLFIDSAGNATELSLVRAKDGKKAGNSMIRRPNQSFYVQNISKFLRLGLEGVTITNPGNLRITAHENGKWVNTEYTYDTMSKKWGFLIGNYTDSIWVSMNQDSNLLRLNYEQLPEIAEFSVYLIKPGQAFLPSSYGRIPVKIFDHHYAILWDYEWLGRKYGPDKIPNESGLMDILFKELGIPPLIYFVFAGGYQNTQGLDLSQFSGKERERILSKLLSNPAIRKISSVFEIGQAGVTYTDGGISLQMHYRLKSDEIKAIVNLPGLTWSNPYETGNINLRYDAKFIDGDLLKVLVALSRHPDVLNVSMNHFMPVTLDRKE